MSKVLIAGGGAAGMFAAAAAAGQGHRVILFEKNDRLGRKLFITGKDCLMLSYLIKNFYTAVFMDSAIRM